MNNDPNDIKETEALQPTPPEEAPAGDTTPVEEDAAKQAEGHADDDSLDQLKEAIKEQAREDEQPLSASFNLRKILGGDWLTADLLRSQLGVLLLIVVFIIIYISNRYSCQKDMLEIDRLNTELVDAKYRALSSSSELTEKCRESNVLKMMKTNKDSILHIPNQPPYIIEVPE